MRHKSMCKAMAAVLTAAMLFQMGPADSTQAAAKVKLSKKSIVMVEKKSKTVKVTEVVYLASFLSYNKIGEK